jgi:hypothetical protein
MHPTPHRKSAVAAILGVVVGAATMAQAYFGSGHIPSGSEIAGLLGGAGITVSSVVGWFAAHIHITRAEMAVGVKEAQAVSAMVDTVPALATRIDQLSALVTNAVPAPVQVDVAAVTQQVLAELAKRAA